MRDRYTPKHQTGVDTIPCSMLIRKPQNIAHHARPWLAFKIMRQVSLLLTTCGMLLLLVGG